MIRFLAARLIQACVVLLSILTLTFFILRVFPGSPFQGERRIPEHILQETRAYYGLDDPLIVQWLRYLGNFFVRFDGGPSFSNAGFSVNELIGQAFPVSFLIAVGGLAVSLLLGIPAGVVAAARRNTWLDHLLMPAALVGICLPAFVTGPLLSRVFGVELGWFDAAGWWGARSWVLPSVTLGLFYAGYFARLTRAGMLEVLSQDFVRTARAKGLPEWRILTVHTLKGGLLPVINFMGPAVAGLIGGSFVVEMVFAIPGQGILFINAVINRDYPLIMGSVLVYGVLILAMNLLVDMVQVALNPRLRGAERGRAGGGGGTA